MLFLELKKYKILHKCFNFFKRKELIHNRALFKKYGLNKKYYSSISSNDFETIKSPKNTYDVTNSKSEMPKKELFNSFPEDVKNELLKWSDDGYVILKKFFSDDEVDLLNDEVELLLAKKKANIRYGNKIMFAIHNSLKLYQAGTNEKISTILNFLMDKKVSLFQSINFLTGSQQRTHSDSIHMTTFPYGNLIAVWIALEDINSNSGPLHYYPGSHKLPYIMNKDYENLGSKFKLGDKKYNDYEDKIDDVIQKNKLKKKVFLAKKGDILIWHANLLHGGEKSLHPNNSRKSMVLHYYTNDAICFHEITQRPAYKKVLVKPKNIKTL